MTALHPRKLVTVVCEAALERAVLDTLRAAGAGGYTATEARGRGSRGERAGDWEGSRSIEIQVLCDADTAGRLVEALLGRYSADFALTLWVSDVAVARPEKFP
jgi:nitrogen regulatory protein PII